MKYFFLIAFVTFSNTIFAQPVITSFSPASAPIGASVTIKGFNFNTTANNNIVYFGAVKATVSEASDTSIVAIVPYAATHSLITLTTGHLVAYSPRKFFIAKGSGTPITPTTFSTSQEYTAGDFVFATAIADFDGDGRADIATCNVSESTISVFKNSSYKANISFAPKLILHTSPNPNDIKAGDIDGEGKTDLITSNGSSNTISVFLNTSTPGSVSFASKKDFPTVAYSGGFAIGDIDDDGKTDLIQTNSSNNTVSVLLNTGSIGVLSFASPTSFTTGLSPSAVSAIDMDGDGKQDLVVVNQYSNSVSIFKNASVAGAVILNARIDFAAGAESYNLDVGDLDNDSKPDIVTGNGHDSTVSILKNLSTHSAFSFTRQDVLIGVSPRRVAINDIDGDGRLDVAAGGSEMNIAVLQNNSAAGNLSFAPKILYYTGGSIDAIMIEDFDNDAKNDILLGVLNKIHIMRNRLLEPAIASFSPTSGPAGTVVTIKGAGFTAATAVQIGNAPAASFSIVNDTTITAGVASGSSGPVIVTNAFGSSMGNTEFYYVRIAPVITSVLPGSGPAGTLVTIEGKNFGLVPFSRFIYFGAVKAPVISVNDTVITTYVPKGATYDVVSVTKDQLTAYSSARFNVTFPGSSGAFSPNTFGAKTDSATGIHPMAVATGDFDGDGKADIVVANSGSSSISVFQNISDSTQIFFSPKINFPTPNDPRSVAVADMDGDGRLDIAIANTTSNSVSFYKNYSTLNHISFMDRFDVATPSRPVVIKLGDLNADGKPDAVVLCRSGKVSTLKNISGDNFIYYASRIDSLVDSDPIDLAIADFDGDGKPDIAISDSSSYNVTVYRNSTAATSDNITYAARQKFPSGYNEGIAAADMDGDGKTDLVIGNNISERITVLKNESTPGNTSFASQFLPTPSSAYFVAVVDIDGDGKPDAGHSTLYSDNVSILRNSSASSIGFNSAKQFSAGNSPSGIAFADLDGDSKPELISTTTNDNKLLVFRNQTGEIIKAGLCAGGSLALTANISGTAYQWQADSGTGFVNITDNNLYSGTTTVTLAVNGISSSSYGLKFRCLVDGVSSEVTSLKFENRWTGSADNNWENPSNWSCGSTPDANTDVLVTSGNVSIHSNVVVRSLRVNPGVVVTVAEGFTITVSK